MLFELCFCQLYFYEIPTNFPVSYCHQPISMEEYGREGYNYSTSMLLVSSMFNSSAELNHLASFMTSNPDTIEKTQYFKDYCASSVDQGLTHSEQSVNFLRTLGIKDWRGEEDALFPEPDVGKAPFTAAAIATSSFACMDPTNSNTSNPSQPVSACSRTSGFGSPEEPRREASKLLY